MESIYIYIYIIVYEAIILRFWTEHNSITTIRDNNLNTGLGNLNTGISFFLLFFFAGGGGRMKDSLGS